MCVCARACLHAYVPLCLLAWDCGVDDVSRDCVEVFLFSFLLSVSYLSFAYKKKEKPIRFC